MTTKTADHDVIIIGGGPGGLSAALWCADLGLNAVLLEKETEFGGQLLRTFNAISNYLGAEVANGRELRDRFLRQVEKTRITRRTGAEVVSANLAGRTVVLASGEVISGRFIIIATGVSRRKLGIPGEDEFYGKGILESGEKAKNDVADKRVVVVGGGDAALENALIVGRTAEKVFLVHRRDDFNARREFIERAAASENIEFVLNSRIAAIIGNEQLTAVDIQDVSSGTTLHIETDALLVRIGVEPNTKLFRGQIDLDEAGFISIDRNCSTSLDKIFAIGDAANPLAPTISVAVGMGSTAVKCIFSQTKP